MKTLNASFQAGDWIEGTPYRVVRPLGVGGMGEVYEVDHTRTGTRRAIKVVRAPGADPTVAQRLAHEGRLLRLIEHPNVVRVFEAGTLTDARPYFAMELLDGTCLRRLVRRAPLPWPRAVALMIQALDGLEAIHAQGMVHRDVKPSNLFLDDSGCVKVLDLGIAKCLDSRLTGPRTREGVLLGTTRYMAPEQLMGEAVDARADVYAAALVLFELLTGCHPSDAATNGDEGLLDRVERPAPRISPWVQDPLPSGFDEIIQRALAIDPSERFVSAGSMATELRRFICLPPRQRTRSAADRVASLRYEFCSPCTEKEEPTTGKAVCPSRRAPWAWLHAATLGISLACAATILVMTWWVVQQRPTVRGTCMPTDQVPAAIRAKPTK